MWKGFWGSNFWYSSHIALYMKRYIYCKYSQHMSSEYSFSQFKSSNESYPILAVLKCIQVMRYIAHYIITSYCILLKKKDKEEELYIKRLWVVWKLCNHMSINTQLSWNKLMSLSDVTAFRVTATILNMITFRFLFQLFQWKSVSWHHDPIFSI